MTVEYVPHAASIVRQYDYLPEFTDEVFPTGFAKIKCWCGWQLPFWTTVEQAEAWRDEHMSGGNR